MKKDNHFAICNEPGIYPSVQLQKALCLNNWNWHKNFFRLEIKHSANVSVFMSLSLPFWMFFNQRVSYVKWAVNRHHLILFTHALIRYDIFNAVLLCIHLQHNNQQHEVPHTVRFIVLFILSEGRAKSMSSTWN